MKITIKIIFTSFIMLFVMIGCKDKENTFCYEYEGRPSNTLTYKELSSMLNQYDATKKKLFTFENGEEDTRINHFTIQELKAYLAYVEKLAKDKKIELTGINFISAAYPSNYKDKKKRNHQTLVLMPTTRIGDRNDVSFDPIHSEEGSPKTLKEMLQKFNYYWVYDNRGSTHQKTAMMMMQEEEGPEDEMSVAANRAGITPPMN